MLLGQFRETAAYRRWLLCGAAVMGNHVHLVVGVPGDPNAEDLMRDFKAYGSRALNQRWGKPRNGSWWTGGGGSRRKLPNATGVRAALAYLRNQPNPLLIWIARKMNLSGESGASAPGGVVKADARNQFRGLTPRLAGIPE